MKYRFRAIVLVVLQLIPLWSFGETEQVAGANFVNYNYISRLIRNKSPNSVQKSEKCSQSQDPLEDPIGVSSECGESSRFEVDGSLRGDFSFRPDENGAQKFNAQFQKFEFQLKTRIARWLYAVVRTRMEQDVVIMGKLDANHLSVTDYLKEAYLEFALDEFGLPGVVVTVGKHEISSGQDFGPTMSFQSDFSHKFTDPDQGQANGIFISLDKNVKHLFDRIEVSLFNSNPEFKQGNFKFDSFAFRVTRKISEHLGVQSSYMYKKNSYHPTIDPDKRLSFAGIYEKGTWTLWTEMVRTRSDVTYPGTHTGVVSGFHKLYGTGQIDVAATYMKDVFRQYAFGYEFFATRRWAVGPTVWLTFCKTPDSCLSTQPYATGPSTEFSLRYNLSQKAEDLNPRCKWGKDCNSTR